MHSQTYPSLKTKLSPSPVTALGVVLNSIVRSETNPLRKRAILPLLLRQSALCAEGLLGRLRHGIRARVSHRNALTY